MKKKAFETFIYSVVGVLVLLAVLIAFNAVTGTVKKRVDLTKEKAYTLSSGTKAILSKLDTPVKVRFYYSQSHGGDSVPMGLKTYAQNVEDLLSEYKQIAKGKLIIEKFDPQPDSDAEDSARLDGVEGQMLPDGEKFYLGLSVSMLDAKEALPFLTPERERLLEYDLSRAISRVVTPEKPVVGVMSPLPVFGAPANPMMARMGQQQQGQDPWIFISELKNDYTVKQVEMTADKIDDNVKVLVVIHPKDISDTAQFAIDQFIMRGGKLIAFLDATSLVDKNGSNPMMQLPGGGSSLDKLFKAWGIQFENTKVAADLNYKMQLMGRNGQPTDAPAFLSIPKEGINGDDVATSEIDNVWLPFCGVFSGTPVSGLKETILLKTTKDSALVDGVMASLSEDSVLKDFKPSGTEYALAIRLNGKFKTAFPNGKPEDKKDDKKEDKTAPALKSADSLKETKDENAVVLFGDADFIYDQFAVRQTQTIFGRSLEAMNGNLSMAQNLVEKLAGASELIDVRSRATMSRPFTRIREMDARAQKAFQSKIKGLEDSLQETQTKLNELQRGKENNGQRFIMSPEQQAELDKFKKKQVEVNRQLKLEKKQLAREKEGLQNRLKWKTSSACQLSL
ncbi:GldG family protein [Pedosphaera parvula]|uniref:Uncharacterized protein n=1 Tax=Pedosphaera parvula (strain Ellin514) TaxID=320771 RepID=B9XGA9_PEDPL|nr:GldG family protein [Pedosphaera parvula]EEF61271.1 conserved hypothetical protein [Pedosphaera parvula Ellin514]